MSNVKIGIISVLLLCAVGTVFAQENGSAETPTQDFFDHNLGDQQFSIRIGGFLPLFFSGNDDGIQETNMKLGAAGGLRWNAFVNSWLSTGLDLSGSLASNTNDVQLYQFNLSAATTAYPFHIDRFFFPVSLDIGANFMRFQDSFYFGPVVKPGTGVFYTTDSGWSFGVLAQYWIVPEIYGDNSSPGSADTRVGNFLELSLTALYHF
ncbi:MAG: TP0733 family outer membrane beta-barrel protein [Spirochaeta sp.]